MIFLSLRIITVTVVTDHVNFLYITDDENSHYVLAKGLSSMVLEQYNNDKNKKYLCQYCLHGCTSEEELKNHIERCKLQRAERIKLPEIGDKNGSDKVKSAKTEYELHLPLVIYADFESVSYKQDSVETSPSKSFIIQYQHNVPCGNCIFVTCSDGQYFEPPQVNIGRWRCWKVFGLGPRCSNNL